MATSFTSPRRGAGFAIALLLMILGLPRMALAQSSTPLVTAQSPVGLNHPKGWGAIQQTALDSNGDWLVVDAGGMAAYEFPEGGASVVTLVAPGGLNNGYGGGNPGILVDPSNNLYLEGNFNNCLLMFPYGSAATPWPNLSSTVTANTPSTGYCYVNNGVKGEETGEFPDFAEGSSYLNFTPYFFQPWALTIYTGPTAPTSSPYVCPFESYNSSNGACSGSYISVPLTYNILFSDQASNGPIFSLPVTTSNTINSYAVNGEPIAVPEAMTEIVTELTARAISLATDPEGNIYFVEDPSYPSPGGLPGVYEIPEASVAAAFAAGANKAPIASDCPVYGNGSTERATGSSCLTRVDPNLPNVTGVITDPSGNLYISDGTDGVFMVPNSSGTPQTGSAYQVSAVPAQGEVALDLARNILYVPTTQTQNNGQADVAKVDLSYAELGFSTVSTATANSVPVSYTFNGSATPASFVIVEDGSTNPDFSLTGGTCTTGTAYTAGSTCTESVSMTPHSVGSISAKLLMLDNNSNVLASIVLHGTGTGALMQASPALESNIGASGSLSTPSQVALDRQGNVYVADAGKGAVLMYAAGSSAAAKSIGSGLTAPTGVAVDGAGDVFIADSGNVYEVPFGPSGLNASGQVELTTGLGSNNLRLAADGLGNLYVADPSNGRVVKLSNLGQTGPTLVAQSETMMTAGFTAPSAVAVDSNNNLYVIDGSNLFEVAGGVGAPTTLLSTLSGATGVAVDASGAVYISSSGGTERIPLVSGALATGSATAVAASVTNPTNLALDQSSNVYLIDGAAEDVHVVSVNGSLNFAPFTSTNQSAVLPATVTNTGNTALTVTGYSATNPVVDSVPVTDWTAADGTCMANSPIAVGATCEVVVTLNPGPGEQGQLSSQISFTSNSAYATAIDASGTAVALAGSNLNATVASSAQAINSPITVSVTPQSGSTFPSGQVAVTFTSWVAKLQSCPTGQTCGPVPVPVSVTVTGTVNGSGGTSFNLSPIMAGAQTITVEYIGDRTFGRSTTTVNATIAKSQITSLALDPNPPPYLPFVLESGSVSGSIPYDGSQAYWQYSLPVTINTGAGVPTGTITFMDNSSTCPPGTSATGQGAAICALTNYSGVACPSQTTVSTNSGDGIQFIVNSGANADSASAQFITGCLPMPQNTTYTPVVSTHYVTPVYSGDANFQGFTGTEPQLYQALRSPLVTITSSPSTLNVQAGSSASTTLTLTSLLGYGYAGKGGQLNDYNFPVTLSCDNLPPHSECSFTYPSTVNSNQPSAPNSVQIPCSGTTAAADNCLPGTVTMTINTNIGVGTTTSRNAAVASVTLASIFGLGMLSLFFRRRAFVKAGWLPMIVLMVVGCALAVSLSACSTTNLSPQAQLSSPAGSYAVTVTAQQVGVQCIPQVGPNANCTTSSGAPGINVYGSENQVSLPFYVNVSVQ